MKTMLLFCTKDSAPSVYSVNDNVDQALCSIAQLVRWECLSNLDYEFRSKGWELAEWIKYRPKKVENFKLSDKLMVDYDDYDKPEKYIRHAMQNANKAWYHTTGQKKKFGNLYDFINHLTEYCMRSVVDNYDDSYYQKPHIYSMGGSVFSLYIVKPFNQKLKNQKLNKVFS